MSTRNYFGSGIQIVQGNNAIAMQVNSNGSSSNYVIHTGPCDPIPEKINPGEYYLDKVDSLTVYSTTLISKSVGNTSAEYTVDKESTITINGNQVVIGNGGQPFKRLVITSGVVNGLRSGHGGGIVQSFSNGTSRITPK